MLDWLLRRAAMCMVLSALLWTGVATADQGDGGKWAVVIGAQRYPEVSGFAPLHYAERDAHEIYNLLVDPERGGYDSAKVKLLTTDAQPESLPTRNNILAALRGLATWAHLNPERPQPPDTVLVYFSGHGVEEAGESYLVPSDAQSDGLADMAISLDTVWSELDKSGASRQVVIIDACRAQARPGKAGDDRSVEFAQALEEFAKATGRGVMASCSQSQMSYEDDERQHSAFTGILLAGLRGAADADEDGVITFSEAHDYVAPNLRSWSERRGTPQYPFIKVEQMLRMPLVECPRTALVSIASTPDGAAILIDGTRTGKQTPCQLEVPLSRGQQRSATVTLRKDGYDDAEQDVVLGKTQLGKTQAVSLTLLTSAKLPPHLKPVSPGIVATTFYRSVNHPMGLTATSDGRVLVAVASPDPSRTGIYAAQEGHDCDIADAYAPPGAPLEHPTGVAVHPDGRVLVTDASTSKVWAIPSRGSTPTLLTDKIPRPGGILVAPASFLIPRVMPGDILVCSGGSAGRNDFGLYAIDQSSSSVRLLVGPTDLANGLVWAAWGPDGRLYAMEDDSRTRDGVTIVTIEPDGRVSPFLPNWSAGVPQPMAGPIAVHPVTGDVFFAYGSGILRVPSGSASPVPYAQGGESIVGLAFSPDGGALLVSEENAESVVKAAACPVEGKLLVSGWAKTPDQPQPVEFCRVIEGSSANARAIPAGRELSPSGDRVCYYTEQVDPGWDRSRARSQIWVADMNGAAALNLSQLAHLDGINCLPIWSPDATQIAFRHCDAVEGTLPCNTGFELWVMDGNGEHAHQVAWTRPRPGPASECCIEYWWAPTGDRLIYRYGYEASSDVVSVKTDGTDPQKLRSFSGGLSPDGSMAVDEWTVAGMSEGEDGVWRQLRLANSDGSGGRTLVQIFLSNSDVVEHLKRLHEREEDIPGKMVDVQTWVGPRRPRWSPRGDRIAFLGALTFDPHSDIHYSMQVEVWIYDLRTQVLTRVTDDDRAENWLSWVGPNTFPDRPQVTVAGTTITFGTVTREGRTTVIRRDAPPSPPNGYQFRGQYYEITTTAEYSGPVTIAMAYSPEDAPQDDPNPPALLRYNAATGNWDDITTQSDRTTRTVRASSSHL